MYLNILKKDLKRKKAMNTILLIFIILAATFIGASVNIFFSITTAIESYFEKAELTDFISVTFENEENSQLIEDFLEKNSEVDEWWKDECVFVTEDHFKQKDGKDFILKSTGILTSFDMHQQKFFDSENQLITSMEEGTIYLPIMLLEENDLKVGDEIIFEKDGFKQTFKVAGQVKDAFLGSPMMGTARFIMSSKDFEAIYKSQVVQRGEMYAVNTTNLEKFNEAYVELAPQIIVNCDKKIIQLTYVMDTIIAALLIIVSVCLIIIALVILRFTIVFTLSEEFREIGIMKAIGIRSTKIGMIYIIKYLGIAVVGAVIGLCLSIPFGEMLIREVSRNMIMEQSPYIMIINVLCALIVVGIVFMFCYGCTMKIKKILPIEAIRSGTKSERFRKKGFIRLSRSKLPPIMFMAFNDLLSDLKKYIVLLIIFTLGILMVIVPINTINTLRSDHLVTWFSMVKSDVYLSQDAVMNSFMKEHGREALKLYLTEMEETLEKEGIEAKASCEMLFKFKVGFEDKVNNSIAFQGTGTTANQYTYMEGTPPQYADEVAITYKSSEEIGAGIGDTIHIKIGEEDSAYIVTAFFQSMTNLGEGIRFSEKAAIDYSKAAGNFAIQLNYVDEPNKEEKEVRLEQIKTIFTTAKVYTASEYITVMIGDVASQLDGIKQLIVTVVLFINMLVALLMVKTFITKEKGEIAMLKAVGFKTGELMMWQSMRIGIILIAATVLGVLLSGPIANLSTAKVFEMMGASTIEFQIIPWEVYGLYPGMLLVATMVGSMLAALQIRKINAKETNHIE